MAKPAWWQGLSWLDRAQDRVWRADETELVTAPPVLSAGLLRTAPALSDDWWAVFTESLDALAAHCPPQPATRHTAFLTQQRITRLLERVFGEAVVTTVDEWVGTHGDLNWTNLTAPSCWFLDWEDWGAGPRGFDAACLWAASLAVPDVAERIAAERAADLAAPSGRVSWLYACAGIIDVETDPALIEPARRQAQRLLAPVP